MRRQIYVEMFIVEFTSKKIGLDSQETQKLQGGDSNKFSDIGSDFFLVAQSLD